MMLSDIEVSPDCFKILMVGLLVGWIFNLDILAYSQFLIQIDNNDI